MFIALGLSGVIPAMHYVITEGFYQAVNFAALGWLVLMAILYIAGAVIYAVRIPERIWPGKFDIWVRFSSLLATKEGGSISFRNFGAVKLSTFLGCF